MGQSDDITSEGIISTGRQRRWRSSVGISKESFQEYEQNQRCDVRRLRTPDTSTTACFRVLIILMIAALPLSEAFSSQLHNLAHQLRYLESSYGVRQRRIWGDANPRRDFNVYTKDVVTGSLLQETNRFQRQVSLTSSSFEVMETEAKGEDEDDDDASSAPPLPMDLEGVMGSVVFRRADVEALTVPQLKQQLRLRGLKVSGRKQELMDRLVDFSNAMAGDAATTKDTAPNNARISEAEVMPSTTKSKARQFAEAKGKELIDVTPFLDEKDLCKQVKSSIEMEDLDDEAEEESNNKPDDGTTEVWGSQARIVDDYEGRSVVVDNLSRIVVEFQGSNQTSVQAYCVASRDALQGFLAGNAAFNANSTTTPQNAAEQRLFEIQRKREQAAKLPPRRGEEQEGLDEGDENGLYANILERDFTDWGKYTVTGAQLSAQEVQGVLLLPDIYGPFSEDTRALAEKIAFECQPVVVMVPDLFRGRPWKPVEDGKNKMGQTYEEWRATHPELRVSVDIRAAAACLRESYRVSSIAVWGVCYGGGRALEAAAGYLPGGSIHDEDGELGPPPVEPSAVIAWYPARYNAKDLFGSTHKGSTFDVEGNKRNMAVMAIFAGLDKTAGATTDDAALLKSLLEQDDRVKDHMVKVFPNQDHGFAHQGLGQAQHDEEDLERFADAEFGGSGRLSIMEGDAEVACLLSTAWMETYTRVFLPTVGPPVAQDELAREWSEKLEVDLSHANDRDIRQEIEDAIDGFVEEPLGGYRIDQTDESQQEELAALLRKAQDEGNPGLYPIEPDDDLLTIYAKLKASDENFQIF